MMCCSLCTIKYLLCPDIWPRCTFRWWCAAVFKEKLELNWVGKQIDSLLSPKWLLRHLLRLQHVCLSIAYFFQTCMDYGNIQCHLSVRHPLRSKSVGKDVFHLGCSLTDHLKPPNILKWAGFPKPMLFYINSLKKLVGVAVWRNSEQSNQNAILDTSSLIPYSF